MSSVHLEARSGILIITLDRPKANAIDVAMRTSFPSKCFMVANRSKFHVIKSKLRLR